MRTTRLSLVLVLSLPLVGAAGAAGAAEPVGVEAPSEFQEKAIDAVRWYGARGFWQIKVYNSMNPAWVPAMVEEAHRLGMRVAGHVPAFSSADQMIDAGYDEITHINQFVLGWVIGPEEDTRTLFRLTALKRLPSLDLESARVKHTIDLMVNGHKAIDPTLGIHENLIFNRDGQIPRGAKDYFTHMPVGVQRDLKKARYDYLLNGLRLENAVGSLDENDLGTINALLAR